MASTDLEKYFEPMGEIPIYVPLRTSRPQYLPYSPISNVNITPPDKRALTPEQYEWVTPREWFTPEFREEFSTEPRESLRTSSSSHDKYFEPMEERSVHISDTPHQLPGTPPETFEVPPSLNRTVMLTSPYRSEPLLLNIDVDPKPLTDTENGESFICNISLNMQPGGHDMLPQLPAYQVPHSDSSYSDIRDESPPEGYLLLDSSSSFSEKSLPREKSPSPARRPYYASQDIRLQSPPSDLLNDAFLDRTMSWEKAPSSVIYDEEDIRYQSLPSDLLQNAFLDRTKSWEKAPSPAIYDEEDIGYQSPPSDLLQNAFIDRTKSWEKASSPVIYDDEDIRHHPPPPYYLEQDSSSQLPQASIGAFLEERDRTPPDRRYERTTPMKDSPFIKRRIRKGRFRRHHQLFPHKQWRDRAPDVSPTAAHYPSGIIPGINTPKGIFKKGQLRIKQLFRENEISELSKSPTHIISGEKPPSPVFQRPLYVDQDMRLQSPPSHQLQDALSNKPMSSEKSRDIRGISTPMDHQFDVIAISKSPYQKYVSKPYTEKPMRYDRPEPKEARDRRMLREIAFPNLGADETRSISKIVGEVLVRRKRYMPFKRPDVSTQKPHSDGSTRSYLLPVYERPESKEARDRRMLREIAFPNLGADETRSVSEIVGEALVHRKRYMPSKIPDVSTQKPHSDGSTRSYLLPVYKRPEPKEARNKRMNLEYAFQNEPHDSSIHTDRALETRTMSEIIGGRELLGWDPRDIKATSTPVAQQLPYHRMYQDPPSFETPDGSTQKPDLDGSTRSYLLQDSSGAFLDEANIREKSHSPVRTPLYADQDMRLQSPPSHQLQDALSNKPMSSEKSRDIRGMSTPMDHSFDVIAISKSPYQMFVSKPYIEKPMPYDRPEPKEARDRRMLREVAFPNLGAHETRSVSEIVGEALVQRKRYARRRRP